MANNGGQPLAPPAAPIATFCEYYANTPDPWPARGHVYTTHAPDAAVGAPAELLQRCASTHYPMTYLCLNSTGNQPMALTAPCSPNTSLPGDAGGQTYYAVSGDYTADGIEPIVVPMESEMFRLQEEILQETLPSG